MKLRFYSPHLPIMSSRAVRSTLLALLMLVLFGISAVPLSAQELQQALTHYNRQEFKQAKLLLEPLRDKGRLQPSGFALLALCYLNSHEIEAARQALTIAARLDPEEYLVRVASGNLHLHLAEYQQAEALFAGVYREYPQRRETLQGYIQAIVGQALEAVRRSEYATAVRELERALELQPDNPDLLFYKITVLRKTGRHVELEQSYRRYLELRPASADVHAGLGELLEKQGKSTLAREHFRKAVRFDSADPQPYLVLGSQAAAAGNFFEARSLIQEAAGKAIQMFNSYRMQAAREMDTAEEEDPAKLQRIKALSDEAQRPKQMLEESLRILIRLYSEKEELLEELERLAEWYPSSTDVRTVLAEQLMAAGYIDRARAEWETLIAQYPYYYRAQLGLAECHRRQGQLTKAALAGRRALGLAPEESAVYSALEKIYLQMEKPEVYLQVLEMQILKEKYNKLLYEEAARAADAVGKADAAALFRKRAQLLRDYETQHR